MPGITVTLVDRTGGASLSHENFKAGIMHELEDCDGPGGLDSFRGE